MDRKIVVVDNPLIKSYLTILRNTRTQPPFFREIMEKIGFYIGFEIAKLLDWKTVQVISPLGRARGLTISREVVAVGILGASLPLLYGFVKSMPWAGIGLIAARRIEEHNKNYLDVEIYYTRLPRDLHNKVVVLLDPMLATGLTLKKSVELLSRLGASDIVVASVIASREGLEKLSKEKSVKAIIVCSVDEKLDKNYFIVPGLGDAGDRALSGTLSLLDIQ